MKLLTRSESAAFLRSQGLLPGEIQEVLSGFDFTKPVYEHAFFPDDVLYQYIRLSSAMLPSPRRGKWYSLAGGTQHGVGIFSGLAGRRLHKFEVVMAFSALEGTAVPMPLNWELEIGGPGGSTQVYLPSLFAGRVQAVGPVESGS